jgi:hypothetical protein
MKFSTHRFRLASRSKLMVGAAALLAVASMVGATTGTANAAKPRPPKPTPTPIVVPTVPAPPALSVIAPQNVRVRLAASADTTLVDWDAVPGAATYEFTLDGVTFQRIDFNCACCPLEGQVTPGWSFATPSLVGKQFRVRAVGYVPAGGGARPTGPLSAPLFF